MQVSVSYLSSIYSKEKTLALIEKTTANYIHVDLMDGGFVPNKNFVIDSTLLLLKNRKIPLDIHLMVFDPLIYINDLKKLNPEYITFHIEATKDIVKTIEIIKKNNIKVGLAIKPNTDIYELIPYLSFIDLVLVMSVEPGFGGQPFIKGTEERIKTLINYRTNNNLNFKIEVDGGINKDTINLVKDVDLVVSGSYICNSKDYQTRITNLQNIT